MQLNAIKLRIIWLKQPPKSPFSKGDLRNSPLINGVRGLFCQHLLCIQKVVAEGSLI
uniref:Uncharacterized protein n=1 Tax=Kuenenia stuttgartiensis TaxID=174633 RepID=Q1PV33_KUEST|nr:unknown protein [Candidatus Kuenenia stuttgartiensis]